MDYSLAFRAVVALLSHFCRTCKRYHKQDARASESSAHNGESQIHPSRERGHNKLFTPCPAGNMGITPTPCGHSREYPAQTKRRNFPGKIKRAVHRPARSLVGCPLLLCVILYRFFGLVLFFQPSEDVFQIACRLSISGFYHIGVNIQRCTDLAVSQSVRHFWNGSVPSYQ